MAMYNPYQRLIQSVVEDAVKQQRREFILWGGRLLGKTLVAEALRDRLQREHPALTPVVIVRGRPVADAAAQFKAKGDQKSAVEDARTLIVDDADYLFTNVEARKALSMILAKTPWQEKDRNCTVLLARSTKRLVEAASGDDTCSVLVLKALSKPLDPWTNADKAVKLAVTDLFTDQEDAAIGAWTHWISEQTGRHPAMVGHSLTLLREVTSAAHKAKSAIASPQSDESEPVRTYLQAGLFEHATMLVAVALGDYRTEDPGDYRRLLDTAHAADDSTPVPLSAVRTGLAYVTPLGGTQLVGGLVRQAIQALQTDRPGPRINIRPDPVTPETSGQLELLENGAVVKQIPLAGVLWRIADSLWRAKGSVVDASLLELHVNPGPDSDRRKALNSALQRLRGTLASIGIEHALQNERKKGYKLRNHFATGVSTTESTRRRDRA
jgi:hypothetical protein